jgi:hypothetical protein
VQVIDAHAVFLDKLSVFGAAHDDIPATRAREITRAFTLGKLARKVAPIHVI